MSGWLLYGAYGFTGELTARRAVEIGERPILAGRREGPLAALAEELGLPFRVFDLDDPAAVDEGLDGVDAVVHMAGPFSKTSRPMVDACLRTATHYLDITGEIGVFEAIFARDEEARAAGVSLVPGVGFDVVPTDGMAAILAEALPEADAIELAFFGVSTPTAGTARTSVEGIASGGAIRRGGRIESVPYGWRTRRVPFPSGERLTAAVPWGDVSTAFHSTGIPDGIVYMALPRRSIRLLPWLSRLAPLLRTGLAQRVLKWIVGRYVTGPDERLREEGFSEIWGEVRSATERVWGTLRTPESYAFTAESSLAAVRRVLADRPVGALTPSRAFGADFVRTLPGVEVHPLHREPLQG